MCSFWENHDVHKQECYDWRRGGWVREKERSMQSHSDYIAAGTLTHRTLDSVVGRRWSSSPKQWSFEFPPLDLSYCSHSKQCAFTGMSLEEQLHPLTQWSYSRSPLDTRPSPNTSPTCQCYSPSILQLLALEEWCNVHALMLCNSSLNLFIENNH